MSRSYVSAWLFGHCDLGRETLLRTRGLQSEFTEPFHFLLHISHGAQVLDVQLLSGVRQLVHRDFDFVHEDIHLRVVLVIDIS